MRKTNRWSLRAGTWTLALATLMGGITATPARAHHEEGHEHGHGRPQCTESYRHYPGTGRACRNERGNFNVQLDNGQVLETHGPDAVESGGPVAAPGGKGGGKPSTGGGGSTTPATYHGGVCTSAGNRNELIYAVAGDDFDDYAVRAPQIRQTFVQVDTFLNSEAGLFSTEMHYRVRCDADGQPTVHHVVLPNTSRTNFSFYSITNDLWRMGYADPDVNYWVFFDEQHPGYGGEADMCQTEPGWTNQCSGKTASSYAVTYGSLNRRVFMHESGHNLGAVLDSAPNSSGSGHCNDGYDIMCYADGGYTSDYRIVCSDREHFDCNHDDYFHPNPPAGSYLEQEWNLASCMNGFIKSSRCNRPATVTAGADTVCLVFVECSTGAARAKDVDGDMVSWRWSFSSCPGACPTIRNPEGTFWSGEDHDGAVTAALFTPTRSGTYRLQVAVTDAQGNVGTDEVLVTVP